MAGPAYARIDSATAAPTSLGAAKSKVSADDQSFVDNASQAGATEIAASRLALKNSSDAQVKSFAKRMITDHTRLANNLAKVAKKKGVAPRDDSADAAVLSSLQDKKGAEFDTEYLKKVALAGHKQAVDIFSKESESGGDAQLKALATKALPEIRHHLEMAQSLAKAKNVSE
jgi:putative membrane protein